LDSAFVNAAHEVIEASRAVELLVTEVCKVQNSFYLEEAARKRITAPQAKALSDLYCESARHPDFGWPKLKALSPKLYSASGITIPEMKWMTEVYRVLDFPGLQALVSQIAVANWQAAPTKSEIEALVGAFLLKFYKTEDSETRDRLVKLVLMPESASLPNKMDRLLRSINVIGEEIVRSRQQFFCSSVRQSRLGKLPANDANYASANCK
jgi:hypothetical protein